jgi:hypothetical protein
VTVHRDKFLIINQLAALISQIYFRDETLHISESSPVHQQVFLTVHTAMVYVRQVCWQLASRIRMELRVPSWSCLQAVSKPVWHIPLLCVQRKTPDDGQRNCPKHVEFHSKNKFEKLVHLFCSIIRNLTRCMVTWTSNQASHRYSYFSWWWAHSCPKHVEKRNKLYLQDYTGMRGQQNIKLHQRPSLPSCLFPLASPYQTPVGILLSVTLDALPPHLIFLACTVLTFVSSPNT